MLRFYFLSPGQWLPDSGAIAVDICKAFYIQFIMEFVLVGKGVVGLQQFLLFPVGEGLF